MKLVRLKKGENDFALANITLGKICAIKNALEASPLTTLGKEVLDYLNSINVDTDVQSFGNELFGKVASTK